MTSRTRTSCTKLFNDVAPRYTARAGGYTRILRLGYRRGDSAAVAEIELLGSEYDPNADVKADKGGDGGDEPKKKTMGERLRGALGRGRPARTRPARSSSRPRVPRRVRRRAKLAAVSKSRRRQRAEVRTKKEEGTNELTLANIQSD